MGEDRLEKLSRQFVTRLGWDRGDEAWLLDEVTRLRKQLGDEAWRVRELEEGLRPFAEAADERCWGSGDLRADDSTQVGMVTLGDLRRARSLLAGRAERGEGK